MIVEVYVSKRIDDYIVLINAPNVYLRSESQVEKVPINTDGCEWLLLED